MPGTGEKFTEHPSPPPALPLSKRGSFTRMFQKGIARGQLGVSEPSSPPQEVLAPGVTAAQ